MKSLFEVFANEWRSLVRSKTILMLLVASVAWMFAAPQLFTGDGTADGFRQMSLHYSLGGVAAMLAITLTIAAAGSVAKERAAKRLALTMVRPVRYFAIALGKMLALAACGALVLGVAAAVEYARSGNSGASAGAQNVCRHVLKPIMPPVREEAEAMYADYMASSNTPVAVKQAKKEVVLRMLANRAVDRYDTIGTNCVWRWKFEEKVKSKSEKGKSAESGRISVRLKFSTMFDQRDDVEGELRFGNYSGVVSNITQAVIEVPLEKKVEKVGGGGESCGEWLEFENLGKNQVMLRPRRDVELLVPADSFGFNLWRAYLELVAMLALLIAFGVFLGTALGRPTALFTAIAVLLLSEMAPSVVDNYVDELETDKVDAVGLAITRFSSYVTKPVSSLRPLEALSLDECVEMREVLRVLACDLVLLPLLFALLSALVMPRKQDF